MRSMPASERGTGRGRRAPPLATLGPALLCLACLALTPACPAPTPAPTLTPEPEPEPDSSSVIPTTPANHGAGEQLDVTIPIVGGGTLELASLRGQPVLVEISASWELGFAEAHVLYAELLAEHPELEVVLVVADPEDAGLDGLPSNFHLAWDPAGALAAKLSVATFPTMFVLDRGGQISYVDNGWDERIAASLSDAVALASAGSDPGSGALEHE